MTLTKFIEFAIDQVEHERIKLVDIADGYDIIYMEAIVSNDFSDDELNFYYPNENWIMQEVLAYFNVRKLNFTK